MIYILLAIFVVALDQITKYLAVLYLQPVNTVPLIQDVFHLTYAENTGAAFSILSDKQTFLIIITIIFIVFLILYTIRLYNLNKSKFITIVMALIVGGAVGNLIDRIRLNYVVDLFDFRLIDFAVFNVADSFVSVCTVLLCLVILIKKDIKL